MWLYKRKNIKEIPHNIIGFVYQIENLLSKKKYIGKKNFFFLKTKQVKGKKKRFKIESDWKEYWGSNEQLKEDVLEFGEENFKRTILRLCSTKAEMSYFEAKYQFDNDVLFREDFYNNWISVKITKKHLTKVQL